jgi:selenocysteine-specific elongation factor
MDLVIGTAGHIDHGKTSLIKVLTGKDADRLPEEKARGITIDLGFAELVLGETRIGLVDVPGHERFIRNMLAGATGIDAVLLVVAADEGVMPQTREHFDICSLLRIKNGLVVITKTDLVEPDWISAVEEDVSSLLKGSFLQNAPRVHVSSKTGEGVQSLVAEIQLMAESVEKAPSTQVVRLPIDRSFAIKGFGTVVTGTLAGGEISVGDELVLFPENRQVRVRGIQIHGQSVERTFHSQRTAVNLSGVDYKEVERGYVLTGQSPVLGCQVLDALVEVLASAKDDLKSRQRVRVHHGSTEALARVHVMSADGSVAPGETAWVQLRLESSLPALVGDRFVLRSYSPQITIGGGEVVKIHSQKYRKKNREEMVEFLAKFHSSGDDQKSLLLSCEYGFSGIGSEAIQMAFGWSLERAESVVDGLLEAGSLCGSKTFAVEKGVLERAVRLVEDLVCRVVSTDPLSNGVSMSVLRKEFKAFPEALISLTIETLIASGGFVVEGDLIRPNTHSASLPTEETPLAERFMEFLEVRGFEGPRKGEVIDFLSIDAVVFERILSFLVGEKKVVLVSNDFVYSSNSLNGLKEVVLGFAASSSDRVIDVSIFKSLTGLSRKYAIPLLEYLDLEKITVRVGEKRVVIKK